MNFCLLGVNLCEMRFFRNSTTLQFLEMVLNSKQTLTMAEYTFNYIVFSLLTTGRLPHCGLSLRTESSGMAFQDSLLGAPEELFAFSPAPKDKAGAC